MADMTDAEAASGFYPELGLNSSLLCHAAGQSAGRLAAIAGVQSLSILADSLGWMPAGH